MTGRPFAAVFALTPQELGKTIRRRRKALGLTLDELSDSTGYSKRTLINIEKGGDAKFSTITTVLSWIGLALAFTRESESLLKKTSGKQSSEEQSDVGVWF